MQTLTFDLDALMPADPIVPDDRWSGQINFPHEIRKGSFRPARSKFFFVDAGTKAKYSFVTGVPENTAFLLLHCNFDYVDRGKTGHTAEKTLRIQGGPFVTPGSVPEPSGVQRAGAS